MTELLAFAERNPWLMLFAVWLMFEGVESLITAARGRRCEDCEE